jgi:hypothetical protein
MFQHVCVLVSYSETKVKNQLQDCADVSPQIIMRKERGGIYALMVLIVAVW